MYAAKAWAWIITAAIGYLFGSLSGSITVSKLFYHDDIRRYGSGNAGTTNVLRTYGFKKAVLTIIVDFGKTFAAIIIGKWFIGDYAVAVAGTAVTLGHAFPIYYGFKGGKAAACSAACMFMMDVRLFIVAAIVFFGSFFIKRIVSLSTLLTAVTLPLSTWFFLHKSFDTAVGMSYMVFALYICFFVIYLHRSNIKRLMNGTELSFNKKGK
ncbi:MAG: glycerol-3-phosphate 1-O-acyltransferase PlsY [Clostridiaceae bacterium]|nr:glycerol-3-phosphate 1-O-acyltransferase PlsY [Clostridiaceae bacterium]